MFTGNVIPLEIAVFQLLRRNSSDSYISTYFVTRTERISSNIIKCSTVLIELKHAKEGIPVRIAQTTCCFMLQTRSDFSFFTIVSFVYQSSFE